MSTAPAHPDARLRPRSRLHAAVSAVGVYVLVGGLFVLGCALFGQKFWSDSNLRDALKSVTLLGVVCVGAAFITYSRHYVDLSIPGIMALSGIVAVSNLKFGFAAGLACGLGAGLLVGLLNGLAVGYLRLNPIIWTLAMMSILMGVIRKSYGGRQVYPDQATAAGRAFLDLYGQTVFGLVPLPVAVLALAAAIGWLVMSRTSYGQQLKLVGSSYETARLTGVNVRATVMTAFILSSLTSALAGILLTSFNKVGASYIGKGMDFDAITAIVIGGMTLAGGRGSIVGVIGGVMVIALMNNIMDLVRIPELALGPWRFKDVTIGSYQKAIVQGVVFILVVWLTSFSRRKSGLDDA